MGKAVIPPITQIAGVQTFVELLDAPLARAFNMPR
jgi:hypothetical protein